jgi:prophage regulatory protein
MAEVSERLLNVHGVVVVVGLSKSRIYAMVRLGQFPRPRRIEGRSMWRQSEVELWIGERWESAPVAGTVAGSEWTPKEKAA